MAPIMPVEWTMQQSKTFSLVQSLDDQNRVNDAQKVAFEAMVAASDVLSEQRQAAYLIRWREALVHIGRGDAVLDIGGGWPIERVWNEIIGAHRVAYHLLDIDLAIVADARERLPRYGLAADNASVGLNTVVPYPDGTFDAVFSSHCIEHSSDLPKTLTEIHRVLRPDGTMIFAVPFGFDSSDEHLICLDVEGWTAITEMAGFEVRSCHLATTYVTGGDLLVVARRKAEPPDTHALSAFADRYTKGGKTLILADDSAFQFHGDVIDSGAHRVLSGVGSGVVLDTARPAAAIVFFRHQWSGVVEVIAGHQRRVCDLHTSHPHLQAFALDEPTPRVEIRVLGRNRGLEQAVLHGALLARQKKSPPAGHGWPVPMTRVRFSASRHGIVQDRMVAISARNTARSWRSRARVVTSVTNASAVESAV